MRSFAAGLVSLLVSGAAVAGLSASGVVVERVAPGGTAATAGLAPGDVLVEWSRAASPPANPAPASGRFLSPFDVREVEVEQSPRGELTVLGLRGDQPLQMVIPSGRWRMDTRPAFDPATRAAYLEALSAIETGDVLVGVSALERLAASARERGNLTLAAWLFTRAASALQSPDTWADNRRLLDAAVHSAQSSGDPRLAARTWELLGEALKRQGQFEEAAQAHQQALGIRQELAPESLAVAASLNHLGSVVWRQGDLERARELWERCMALRARHAPDSIDEAASLNNLGILAYDRGDLEAADDLWGQSLAVIERLEPDSVLVAASLNNLVLVAHHRGDLATAEERGRRALAILERLEPDSFPLIASLNNLGLVAHTRGDLATAEEAWRRAAAILEQIAPTSLELAAVLNNLAEVASIRGDLAAAEDVNRRALAIREALAPVSLDVAMSLYNLSLVAGARGDGETKERLALRAFEMRQQLAPNSLPVATSLGALGSLALDGEDLDSAEELFHRAFEIRGRLAPGSQIEARSLHALGEVARRRGDLSRAEDLFRRALATLEVLTPGTVNEAESLHALGLVLRDRGRPEPAREMLTRAVAALEAQRVRRGGTLERRGLGRTSHLAVYHDLIHLLLDMDRPEEAFAVLERSRAQGLLAILAERDLVFAADIPKELDRERRMTAAAADRVLADLGGLSVSAAAPDATGQRGIGGLVPVDGADQRDELLAELRRLRRRQEEIRTRIRAASPRLAALIAPEPLDVEGARAMLETGTVLLAYVVGDQGCHLFVVEEGRAGLQVVALEIDSAELSSLVHRFRVLIQSPTSGEDEIARLALRLGDTLLAPVTPALIRARRLVIVPDGPLHLLPFAALRLSPDRDDERFLVELKPLSVVVSATLLAELKRARRPSRPPKVVAFADPSYPEHAGSGTPLAVAALRSGVSLRSLPATRREAESLRSLYGPGTVTWLGDEATEERVKSLDRSASILHLAAHGLVSERLPLESAIALAVPGVPNQAGDNGLLQAWEVLEQVRIDADLVTLSACATALGKEVTGEGIVGLTRAFQYAGARTVLASLWAVADDSTAELMDRLYRQLHAGTATDEALRAAQLELLSAPLRLPSGDGETRELDAHHPFHWAAFQVIGDWR